MRHRMAASAFRELRKRPGVMLSYFVARRTLRDTAQFRGNVPGLLVLIVDKGWVGRFHRACELLLSGQRQAFFNAETSRHQVVSFETAVKKRIDVDLLRYSAQTIVVADSFDTLPVKARLGADEILYVSNPTPRHVQAVRKLTGRSRIDGETARLLANARWETIEALLCRQSLNSCAVKAADAQGDVKGSGPRLGELPGFRSVRTWASELVVDLSLWRKGELDWTAIDRAALLIGPPGVGKTMCAGALAAELGLPLIATSVGQWQSAGEGYLGNMLKSMRAVFQQASGSKSGALLFIDELDSIGNRSRQTQHAYYETQVVNTFLELTSQVAPGVILLAATNRIENIEPAVLRSGRFERHIAVGLPTAEERAEILSYHLGAMDSNRLRPWTDQLHEFSPADLERIGRAIKRSARSAGREIGPADVEAGMPVSIDVPEDVRWRIAIHECGHALIALSSGFIDAVTIALSEKIFVDRVAQTGGSVDYDTRDPILPTEDFLRARIRISLAGHAAEELELGSKSTGAGGQVGSDLDDATSTARLMVGTWGMGRVPRYFADQPGIGLQTQAVAGTSNEVDRILLEEWHHVKALLSQENERLRKLASVLVDRGRIRIDAAQLRDLLE